MRLLGMFAFIMTVVACGGVSVIAFSQFMYNSDVLWMLSGDASCGSPRRFRQNALDFGGFA